MVALPHPPPGGMRHAHDAALIEINAHPPAAAQPARMTRSGRLP